MHAPWTPVGAIDPTRLTEERLQLHYGAWILGSVAHALVPPRDDDGHTNLAVRPRDTALVTHPLDPERDVSLALVVDELSLAFQADGQVEARYALVGRSVDEALAWATKQRTAQPAIARRAYPDFPASPLLGDGTFAAGDPRARRELGFWFTNAAAALRVLVEGEDGATPIRVWPHHFDIGTLIDLGEGRGVGIGLSPGDASFDQPYFYAYAYPLPDQAALPPWTGAAGRWNTQGFTGALLTATELLASGNPGATTMSFLRDALAYCRAAATR